MGTPDSTVICRTCSCQFDAKNATPLDEDELTLAPVEEAPTIKLTQHRMDPLNVSTELQLEQQASVAKQSCKECNNIFDGDAFECPQCGVNVTIGRKLDPTELDPYHGVFGFDRYLMRHTQDSNAGGLMVWLHVFLGFIGLVTMLLLGGWAYGLVPMMAVLYIAYRLHANRTRAFQRGKGLIPKVLLLYNRLTSWEAFVSGDNPSDCIVSMRSPQFTDANIAAIDNPEFIEVLDIAGSSVTDIGIRYLATFTNLRVLVVERCTVAEQSLDDVQASLPRVCIWRP